LKVFAVLPRIVVGQGFTTRRSTVDGISVRYLGSAVGLGFGVLWMALGVGSAIACLLLAALGYCVAFVAERARAEASRRRQSIEAPELDAFPYLGQVEIDEEPYADVPDDAAAPLAAEAEYGWPIARDVARDDASVAR
jgi:hypothetical protein